jgi:hypothetical protein
MHREKGSDATRIVVQGGRWDGAEGSVESEKDDGKTRILAVRLDSGERVEFRFSGEGRESAASNTLRLREIGS